MQSFYAMLLTLFLASASLPALTTSLIIPCHYKHAQHLHALLKAYEKQTVMPDEVVVAISEFNKVDPSVIDTLREQKWKFSFTMIVSEQPKTAGENRNSACEKARGDIFILQDADDLPHPQRIEIVKYFFEQYQVNHIIHQFISAPTEQRRYRVVAYDLHKIPYLHPATISDIIIGFFALDTNTIGGYTHGHVAITRELFKDIQWDNKKLGQDMRFTEAVYKKNKSPLILQVPLIVYRHYLSSHKP